jgi:hypothetical protein
MSKYAEVFADTFTAMLEPHGYRLDEGSDDRTLTFHRGRKTIAIANPSRKGGSRTAWFCIIRRSGRVTAGQGRDQLADNLGIPHFHRAA